MDVLFEVLVLDVGEQFFFCLLFVFVGLFLVFSPFCLKKTKHLAEDFKKEKKRVNILGQKDPKAGVPHSEGIILVCTNCCSP